MKTNFMYGLLMGAGILVSGCSSDTNSAYAPPLNYSAQQMKMDARILGGVLTIDQNEIAAGQMAEAKSANPAVKGFANLMVNQHSRNMQEVQSVSQRINVAPVKGEVATRLQRKGRQELASLKRMHNGAFDRAYMADMVKGHQAALHLLDKKLIPMAVNPLLKNQLVNTRDHVNAHLQKALAVQSQLKQG